MTQSGERGQSVWTWMTNRESGRRPSQCGGGDDGGRCVEREYMGHWRPLEGLCFLSNIINTQKFVFI